MHTSTPKQTPLPELELKKLDGCRHCLVGTVTLETTRKNISQMIGGPAVIEETRICYCDNCATLFHVNTYLEAYTRRKPVG